MSIHNYRVKVNNTLLVIEGIYMRSYSW